MVFAPSILGRSGYFRMTPAPLLLEKMTSFSKVWICSSPTKFSWSDLTTLGLICLVRPLLTWRNKNIVPTNQSTSLIAYKAARTKAKYTVNRAKKRFFKEKTKSLAEDPNNSKSFWSIVKGIGTNFCLTSISPLTCSDNTISSSYR